MSREWRELGEMEFPGEEFGSAWEVYEHAARLIIDRAFTVTVAHSTLGGAYLAEMLRGVAEGAEAVAKRHLVDCLAATAFLEDLKRGGSGGALSELLDEATGGGA